MNSTPYNFVNWLLCIGMSIRAGNWNAVRFIAFRPRFSCAVIWCYTHGYGTWCEWVCGVPGLTAEFEKRNA